MRNYKTIFLIIAVAFIAACQNQTVKQVDATLYHNGSIITMEGDEATFQLRQGGLGIWQVNMDKVYDQQKLFYDCDGMLSCMLENTAFESD